MGFMRNSSPPTDSGFPSVVALPAVPKAFVPTINNRTLIAVRWMAVFGQAATLMLVHRGLDISLHLGWALGIVGVSAFFNIMVSGLNGGRRAIFPMEAALYLAFDTLQLAALLCVTGGLNNPFSVLLLAPVTVAASLLPRRQAGAIAALALACVGVLSGALVPLPWPGPLPPLSGLQSFGFFAALAFSIVFMAVYVWRTSLDARNVARALDETRMALSRQQQTSALGAQAAAAAHELGSPLSTIHVIAGELKKDVPAGSPWAEDIDILHRQSLRCREILAGFSKGPRDRESPDLVGPYWPQALVSTIVEPYRAENPAIDIKIESAGAPGTQMPTIPRRPEIVSGLGNIFQNAIQHARRAVHIRCYWDKESFTVSVEDDGQGFSQSVLSRIGEPYVSTKAESGKNMGLGLFISQTLLGQTGARLGFSNWPEGGAVVTVRWARKDIENPDGMS